MKKILKKEQLLKNIDFYLEEMNNGKIFVFPTDTIYGIGCIATNDEAINNIKEIKKRDEKPLSIIAPSKNWILDNFEINETAKEWIEKLPGKYTFVLKNKNKNIISEEVNSKNPEKIGIRIPNHWFALEVVSKLNKPFIATSVNISGENNLEDVSEIRSKFADQIDYIIDEGIIDGKSSTVIDLTGNKIETLRK